MPLQISSLAADSGFWSRRGLLEHSCGLDSLHSLAFCSFSIGNGAKLGDEDSDDALILTTSGEGCFSESWLSLSGLDFVSA